MVIFIDLRKGDNMYVFDAIGDFFGSITDWMNDNLEFGGPLAAIVAVVLCVVAGVTFG